MSEKKREVNAFGKRNPFTSIIKGNIGIIVGCIILMYEIIASGLSVMTSDYMGSVSYTHL